MKKTLLLTLALALTTTFCAKKKEAPSIKLSQPKWSEVNKYQIVMDTMQVGTYVLINKASQLGNEPTIEITAITKVKSINGESSDSSTIILHKDNLKPIKSSKTILSRGKTITSEVTYGKNNASIKANLSDGNKSITIPIEPSSIDNDEITTLLSAVDLKAGEEKDLNLVIGLSGTSVPLKIKGLGEEKIKVPAGEFDCNKYEMDVVSRTVVLWYEKTEARRMVKYSDEQDKMVMELMP
jgi:hypothetical protein